MQDPSKARDFTGAGFVQSGVLWRTDDSVESADNLYGQCEAASPIFTEDLHVLGSRWQAQIAPKMGQQAVEEANIARVSAIV